MTVLVTYRSAIFYRHWLAGAHGIVVEVGDLTGESAPRPAWCTLLPVTTATARRSRRGPRRSRRCSTPAGTTGRQKRDLWPSPAGGRPPKLIA